MLHDQFRILILDGGECLQLFQDGHAMCLQVKLMYSFL